MLLAIVNELSVSSPSQYKNIIRASGLCAASCFTVSAFKNPVISASVALFISASDIVTRSTILVTLPMFAYERFAILYSYIALGASVDITVEVSLVVSASDTAFFTAPHPENADVTIIRVSRIVITFFIYCYLQYLAVSYTH